MSTDRSPADRRPPPLVPLQEAAPIVSATIESELMTAPGDDYVKDDTCFKLWKKLKKARRRALPRDEVDLVVEMEVWEGITSPKVRWVNEPRKGSVGEAMDAARKAAFRDRIKGQMALLDSAEGDDVDDEDIPF